MFEPALEQSRVLGPDSSTFTVEGLQPDEALAVSIVPISGQRTGVAASLSTRTNPISGTITGLRVLASYANRILLTWNPVSRATGYKITWFRDDGTHALYSTGSRW